MQDRPYTCSIGIPNYRLFVSHLRHSYSVKMVRTQAAKRILALAKEAAVLAENNGARAFSSIASKGAKHGLSAVQQGSRIAGTSIASKCRCSCGRVMCMGNHYHTSVGQQQAEAAVADEAPHAPSLTARHLEVAKHFPTAMGVDDFIARLEMALAAYGFTGDNAIGECVDLGWKSSSTTVVIREEDYPHCFLVS